jgi:hypothetical protein
MVSLERSVQKRNKAYAGIRLLRESLGLCASYGEFEAFDAKQSLREHLVAS